MIIFKPKLVTAPILSWELEKMKVWRSYFCTIIATGFDVDQQNDITNTEVKKVVHALEDEQTMQHDLMPLDPLETPSAL